MGLGGKIIFSMTVLDTAADRPSTAAVGVYNVAQVRLATPFDTIALSEVTKLSSSCRSLLLHGACKVGERDVEQNVSVLGTFPFGGFVVLPLGIPIGEAD